MDKHAEGYLFPLYVYLLFFVFPNICALLLPLVGNRGALVKSTGLMIRRSWVLAPTPAHCVEFLCSKTLLKQILFLTPPPREKNGYRCINMLGRLNKSVCAGGEEKNKANSNNRKLDCRVWP